MVLTGLMAFSLQQVEAKKYEPTWESLSKKNAAPQWFEDAVLGIYFHWGIYSVPGNGCWTGMNMYKKSGLEWQHLPEGYESTYEYIKETYGEPGTEWGYKDFVPMFTAEKWDPKRWAALFKHAGADYAGPVAVHHDGFELWDAEDDEWDAAGKGPKRDIVGEMAEAVRAYDMKFFTSIHQFPIWWYFDEGRKLCSEGVDVRDPKYVGLYGDHEPGEPMPEGFQEKWYHKILELVDKYQPDQMWFDGSPPSDYQKEFLAYYFNAAQKWGRDVMVSHKNTQLPLSCSVLDIEVGRKEEPVRQKWQTDITLGSFSKIDEFPSWAYSPDAQCRPINTIVDGIVDRMSKNGATLLDVAPKADGTLPGSQVEGLKELGKWMAINKSALYATVPASFATVASHDWKSGSIRFLRKNDYLFAIDLEEPQVPYEIPDVKPVRGSKIKMFGSNMSLPWHMDGDNLVIEELPDPLPCDYAWSFEIQVVGEPESKNTSKYEPTWKSLSKWQVPQWFEDAVLGFYCHWGVYSVPGYRFNDGSEQVDSGLWYGWFMYVPNDAEQNNFGVYDFHRKTYGNPCEFGYHDLVPLFKAQKWDPDRWAQLYKHAGADFAGVCGQFSDGFPMWDSKYDTYNAMAKGPRRDVVGEMFAAARKQGMKTVITFHEMPGEIYDAGRKLCPEGVNVNNPKYADLYEEESDEELYNKLYEVVDKYQPDQMWFQYAYGEEEQWKAFIAHYFNSAESWNKEVLISHKGGSAPLSCSVLDLEGGIFPDGIWEWEGMEEPQEQRWQKDVPIGNYWAYAEGVGCRPVNMLVDGIVDRISKNGVTLLDVAPKADGTLPQEQIDGIKQLGDWMKHNKEALYAARPAPFNEGGVDEWQAKGGTVRFTEKGNYLYAIDLGNVWPSKFGFADYPDSNKPTAPYTVPGVKPIKGSEIIMLGSEKSLPWHLEGNNLVIEELPDPLPCDHAWSFKIQVAGKPESKKKVRYEPTEESLSKWECPQWFQDAVLGVYVHWSPGSVPGFAFKLPSERVDSGIWYGGGIYKCYTEQGYNANPKDPLGVYEFHVKTYGDPEKFGYPYLIELFKAEKWDPDEWAELFNYAGCDYAGLAAEHGDGYPMYNSTYDSINSFTTGPKRDFTKELFAAVRKRGMKTVATVHEHPGSLFGQAWEFAPADSHVRNPKYRDLFEADSPQKYTKKMYELMEKYRPDQLWIDNPILSSNRKRWLKFVSDYYNKGEQWDTAGVLISQKGRSETMLQHTVLDIEGGEFPGGKWEWRGMKEPYPKRWQKDVPIGNYWAYAEGVGCRPVNMLVDGIVDRISKNGVTLLDVAPKADGTLPKAQIEGLKRLGAWMAINKEALYAARAAPFKAGGVDVWQAKGGTVRFTEKGNYLYAIDLGNKWPTKRGFADYEESKKPTVPYTLPGVRPVKGSMVRMLGSDKSLTWHLEGNNLVIEELPAPLPCEYAWSFKIQMLDKCW